MLNGDITAEAAATTSAQEDLPCMCHLLHGLIKAITPSKAELDFQGEALQRTACTGLGTVCFLQLWTREAVTQPGAPRNPQEPGPVPQPQPHAATHQAGFLQGCCPKSLLPNFCPTQWPGATMAQVIAICVWAPAVEGDCCSATGSSGGAQTPSAHLSPRGTFPAAPPTQTPRTQAQAYRGAGLLLCACPSTWAHLSPRLPGDDL